MDVGFLASPFLSVSAQHLVLQRTVRVVISVFPLSEAEISALKKDV